MLRKALLQRQMSVAGQSIEKELNLQLALDSRDSLAKCIYTKLFDRLVVDLNKTLGDAQQTGRKIGILDIYGFESFKYNSFEQFCINFANEKLQQNFNTHIFKMEQAEYEREQIDWSYITFDDNQDVLDLIERKPQGSISILDDQCVVPKANAQTLADSLYNAFDKNKANDPTERFSKPKRSQTDFSVRHYAGTVTYSVDKFLDKNKDYTIEDHLNLLQGAGNSFVSELFAPTQAELDEQAAQQAGGRAKKKNKFSSAGSNFKRDLQALMTTIDATEPNYVRCIKPNDTSKPSLFQDHNVLHQLRCGGVLEAVRISCAGFPSRRTYAEFIDRFGLLVPEYLGSKDVKEAAGKILAAVEHKGIAGYQLGLTKVFLRAGQMALLDKLRTDVLTAAARRIQAVVRMFLSKRHYAQMKRAALVIQSHARGHSARRLAALLRAEAAAVTVQCHVRGFLAQRRYKRVRKGIVGIQALWRGRKVRDRKSTV